MTFLRSVLGLLLLGLFVYSPTAAQTPTNPPCAQRTQWVYIPPETCLETVFEELRNEGLRSVGGLAFTPDGTLYVARPALNQIWRMKPDGNHYFEKPTVFAADLPEPPLGLTYDEPTSAWYVSSDTMLLKLTDNDDDGSAEQTILVRDLPGRSGGWLGDVRVGPDRRLYVAKAASCDSCLEPDARRAALLSFALDGSDSRIVATGLRDAYSFTWTPDGALYIVDNERQNQAAELNVVPAGQTGLDFGWPRCDAQRRPIAGIDGATADYCATTTAPILTFDADSHPTGIVYYAANAFPQYTGALFICFAGSWDNTVISGHTLIVARLDAAGAVASTGRLIPYSQQTTSDASIIKTSFHPYRPYSLVISPDGWLYISIAEGRVYRFRPL
ncbi:MAG: PQQ-dependent sugar dehydrogenase [Anaerolineae bacterium]|nr:PQQ-dependent sugar dehydrogenase [Anaerolineae bacterium]